MQNPEGSDRRSGNGSADVPDPEARIEAEETGLPGRQDPKGTDKSMGNRFTEMRNPEHGDRECPPGAPRAVLPVTWDRSGA